MNLVPADGVIAKYNAVGVTDAQGKAIIKTYGFEGAPAGKYKVTVRKLVVEEGAKVTIHGPEYQAVERKYMDAKTTPHEVEILNSKKAVEMTFDVGKVLSK